MWLPYKILLTIIHVLAMPLYVVICLGFGVYKALVLIIAKITQDFAEPLTGSDSVFIADKIWSRPHCSILVGLELNGHISKENAADIFQKIYDLKDSKDRRCYRELGFSLVFFLGHGFWKAVPNFKISDRIHVLKDEADLQQEKNEDVLSTNGSDSERPVSACKEPLTSWVESFIRAPYDEHQPLWDIYLIHNYGGKPNKTFVFLRFHHGMADGMSFVKLFYALCGKTSLPSTFTKPSNSLKKWEKLSNSTLYRIVSGLNFLTIGFIDYICDFMLDQDKHALHFTENGKLKMTGNWICSIGSKIEVSDLKKASKFHGCSIVHIVLAGLTNGMERYFHKYHGNQPIPETVAYTLPLPRPKHPDLEFTNHWCAAKVHAKLGIEKPADQLECLKKEVKRAVTASLPFLTAITFRYVCALFPASVVDMMSRGKATFTIVLSNIVGPQESDLNFGGTTATLHEMFFWMPIAKEAAALSAGIISCNGRLRVCLNADQGCIPDRSRLDDLAMMIDDEIMSLCAIEDTAPKEDYVTINNISE